MNTLMMVKEFFPKYYYVLRELGEDAKPADALKVMESLSCTRHEKDVVKMIVQDLGDS